VLFSSSARTEKVAAGVQRGPPASISADADTAG
jgi:hypothetical protein